MPKIPGMRRSRGDKNITVKTQIFAEKRIQINTDKEEQKLHIHLRSSIINQ